MENVLTLSIICDWMQHPVDGCRNMNPKFWCSADWVFWIGRLGAGRVWKNRTWHILTRSKSKNGSNIHPLDPHPKQCGSRAPNTVDSIPSVDQTKVPQKIHSLAFFLVCFFPHFTLFLGDHLKRWSIACLSGFFPRVQFHLLSDAIQHTHAPSTHFQSHSFSFLSFHFFVHLHFRSGPNLIHFGVLWRTYTHTLTHVTAILREDFRFMRARKMLAHKATKRTQRRQLMSFLPWQTSAKWINYEHIFHFPRHLRPTARQHYPIQIQIMVYERSGGKRRMQENCSFYF